MSKALFQDQDTAGNQRQKCRLKLQALTTYWLVPVRGRLCLPGNRVCGQRLPHKVTGLALLESPLHTHTHTHRLSPRTTPNAAVLVLKVCAQSPNEILTLTVWERNKLMEVDSTF